MPLQRLESSYLFLQDLIDLRWNSWVARREVEGPKTIDQVHADARRDDANRARAAAGGPNRGGPRGGGGDYRSGGLDSYGGPPQRCVTHLSLPATQLKLQAAPASGTSHATSAPQAGAQLLPLLMIG